MPEHIPESDEVPDEQFWRNGGKFSWCLPHFDRMQDADPITRLMFNRYPYVIIGAALYVRGHGFGVRWKDTPGYRPVWRYHPLRFLRAVLEIGSQS